MWSGLKGFEIRLNTPDHTFSPGEIVVGRVIVDLDKRKSLRCLKVRFKGAAVVHWNDSSSGGKSTTHYKGEEEYFKTDHYVLGEADGQNVVIETGPHEYPFQFPLPRDIPSSFESAHGTIRYSIKAIMDRPWKFDHTTSMLFTVETPRELTQCTTGMTEISDEEYKDLACFPFCYNMGAARYNIYLPTNGFAIGDAIEAKITLHNTSMAINVTKVKLRLEQVTTLHSQKPRKKTKTETTVVQKVKKDGHFGKSEEIVLGMQVPSLPYSDLVNCSIIDIEYYLKVVVAFSGCHCAMKRKYPIMIGTKSAFSVESVDNSTPMPIAPLCPVESPTPASCTPFHDQQCSAGVPDENLSGFSDSAPNYSFSPSNLPPPKSASGGPPPPSYCQAMGINEEQP